MKNIMKSVVAALCLAPFYGIGADSGFDRLQAWRGEVVRYQQDHRAYVIVSSRWRKQTGNETRSVEEMEAETGMQHKDPTAALQAALKVAQANPADDLGVLALDFLLRSSRTPDQKKAFWPPMVQMLNEHYATDERLRTSLLQLSRSGMQGNPMSQEIFNFLTKVVESNAPGSDLRVRTAYYCAMSSVRPVNNLQMDSAWRLATREKSIEFARIAVAEGGDMRGFGSTLAEEAKSVLNSLENLSIGGVLPNVGARIVEGGEDELKNHRGKVVLMDFWATWCVPCVANLPKVAKLKKEMEGTPFEVIAVSSDDSEDDVIEFIEDRMEMPFVNWHIGADSDVQRELNIQGIPYYFLLDEHGVIQARGDFRGMPERARQLVEDMADK